MRNYNSHVAILCSMAAFFAFVACSGGDDPFENASPNTTTSQSSQPQELQQSSEEETPAVEEVVSSSTDYDTAESDSPTFSYTIAAWDGSTATDATDEVVDYSNSDIFYEANTFGRVVTVTYQGTTATVDVGSTDVEYYVDGAYVTIDMQSNAVSQVEIVVTGSTSDGQLKIYGEKKFKLTLSGVDITCTKGPAINDQCHKRAFVHVADGTTNTLTDATTYGTEPYYLSGATESDEDRKGALFSEGNLIFSGTGVLQVQGNYKHAIASDGYIYVRHGVTLVVTGAAKNALHANGDEDDGYGIYVAGGLIYANVSGTAGKGMKCDLNIDIAGGKLLLYTSGSATYDSSEKDTSSASGLKSDTNITISGGTHSIISTGKGGKGISADGAITISGGVTQIATSGTQYTYSSSQTSSPKGVKAKGNLYITGGALNVSAKGSSSGSEGIESKASIYMTAGTVYSWAYDDAVNATSAINISGGRLYAYGSNNDGIDSNGSLTISGGLVIGSGKSEPECGIDCDSSSKFKITGGTVISVGGTAFQSTPSNSTQCVAIFSGITSTNGRQVSLLNSSGTPLVTFKFPRTLSGSGLAISCDALTKGSSYTLSSGGAVTGYSDSWNGWYDGGTWSGGSTVKSFTQSSTVYSSGSSSSSNQPR